MPHPHHHATAFVSLTRHGCTATMLRQEHRTTAATTTISYDHSPLVHHATTPGLTKDGQHLRSLGGVRTACTLALHQPASPLTRPCLTTMRPIRCHVPKRLLPCSLHLKQSSPP